MNLFRSYFLLAALFLLVNLVAAAPDFDRMMQLAGQRFGAEGRQRVASWRQMLSEAGERAELERVHAVNDFFNRHIRFGEDPETWNLADYWATPLETLGRGQGDCEPNTCHSKCWASTPENCVSPTSRPASAGVTAGLVGRTWW